MARQATTAKCDCGGRIQVTATASPYEFTTACERCTHRGLISWAHSSPPPTFDAPREETQADLFSEVPA